MDAQKCFKWSICLSVESSLPFPKPDNTNVLFRKVTGSFEVSSAILILLLAFFAKLLNKSCTSILYGQPVLKKII